MRCTFARVNAERCTQMCSKRTFTASLPWSRRSPACTALVSGAGCGACGGNKPTPASAVSWCTSDADRATSSFAASSCFCSCACSWDTARDPGVRINKPTFTGHQPFVPAAATPHVKVNESSCTLPSSGRSPPTRESNAVCARLSHCRCISNTL